MCVSGGHQWNHLNSGSSHGEAVCRWRLPHGLPCHRPLPGWHWHQQRKRIHLLPADGVSDCAEAGGSGCQERLSRCHVHPNPCLYRHLGERVRLWGGHPQLQPIQSGKRTSRAVLNVTLEVWLGVITAGHLWSVLISGLEGVWMYKSISHLTANLSQSL